MVLSSISPLFVLWGIRGNRVIPDCYFAASCALLIIVPNAFLFFRIRTAKALKETRELVIGRADDNRDHLLVYLFAILLPFYAVDLGTWREVAAALAAISFIVFAFWHLDLHYMNVLFALLGYRVFTVYSPDDNNPMSGKGGNVLITPRASVSSGERVVAYRLSNTVYLEPHK